MTKKTVLTIITVLTIAATATAEKSPKLPIDQITEASETVAKTTAGVIEQTGDALVKVTDNLSEKSIELLEKVEPVAITVVEETRRLYLLKGIGWSIITIITMGLGILLIIFGVKEAKGEDSKKSEKEKENEGEVKLASIICGVILLLIGVRFMVGTVNRFGKATSPTRTTILDVIETTQKY